MRVSYVDYLPDLAAQHLDFLCNTAGNRRTGSTGNRAACDYIAGVFRAAGLAAQTPQFDCLDWAGGSAHLEIAGQGFEIFPGPFSPAFSGLAPLVAVSSLTELPAADLRDKILLIHGELAAETLMPRHFPFYYPDEHEKVYAALEANPPLAVITATPRGGFMSGGLYPCPMIEDGTFSIPSAYLSAESGSLLASYAGSLAGLEIASQVNPAVAENVLARTAGTGDRLVICAHLDAKPTTPGAMDNAAGVIVLMLLAELLRDNQPPLPVELLALNGEDYYAVPGQLNYLAHPGLNGIRLVINVDGAGYVHGKTAWSQYGLEPGLAHRVQQAFSDCPNSLEGEAWYAGDHTMFIQNGIPAIAITSYVEDEKSNDFMRIIHTAQDRPELVDSHQLAQIALALARLIKSLE